MPSIFSRSTQHDPQDDHSANIRRGLGFLRKHHSTTSVEDHPLTAVRSTFCTRLVKVDDQNLAAKALDTKLSIDWHSVMQSARAGPARWRRVTSGADFAVYTRQESQRFGVLAVGTVPGCVAEIVNVLQSQNSSQFVQDMVSVFGDQFREGSFVHRVDVANENLPDRVCRHDGSSLVDLSVKTVTFNKTSWLADHEEWCYLESLYRHDDRNGGTGGVEKFITTMHPKDIVAGLSGSKTKYFHDIACGYQLRPVEDEDPAAHVSKNSESDSSAASKRTLSVTHVTFYAEFQTPRQFAFLHSGSRRRSMFASDKTIKQRLVRLAESTSRLTVLVRRQRLGLQVLIDGNRFLPVVNTPCKVCATVCLVARQCRLCGHAVCGACSSVHERARQPRRSQTIEVSHVRVCTTCISRVDDAVYTNLSTSSLLGSHVAPDPVGAKSAATMLKDLLQDALLTAPSPNRKAGVMSVIKCVLNQEAEEERGNKLSCGASSSGVSGSATPAVLLTPASSDCEYMQALDYVDVEPVGTLRSDDHRVYQFDARGDRAVPTPVPDDEEARLRAVQRVSISQLVASTELEIICDVAAKEMGCMTSAISIIGSDTFHIVASNTPEMRRLALPRETTMCSHTIMEKSPLIVKHPEADVRFSKFNLVDAFGVQYYCSFPLMGEDDRIIGAMCCINSESMDITESQFAVFKKLTTTASKVVRMETKRRERKLSAASSGSGSCHDLRVAPSA